MRIDASFNFPQLPKRTGQPSTSVAAPSDRESSGSEERQATIPFELAAGITAARAEQSAGAGFYSTDRQLPLSGQQAVDTYLTNATLSFTPGEAEWVGVDTYA
ncbi:hypothetical protein [Motiliproteus sp.]|uniref:hypothetical protein n=1 Tax=Motiliproteus sp. TaxID=1898955 RepID=UPI003BA90814